MLSAEGGNFPMRIGLCCLSAVILIAGWSKPACGAKAKGKVLFPSDRAPERQEDMVKVPAGCFSMGRGDGDPDEGPAHKVCLSAFRIDRLEVSQGRYLATMGTSGHADDGSCSVFELTTGKWEEGGAIGPGFRGKDRPVVCVDWEEAAEFCRREGLRLPTEAEHEYASRAATTTRFSWGDDPDQGCLYANGADRTALSNGWSWDRKMDCRDGRSDELAPVGSYRPNAWGIHDMTGNVLEWVSDWYGEDYYSRSPKKDPRGPSSGFFRVYRGGGWIDLPDYLRPTFRSRLVPRARNHFLGFRCAGS